MTEFELVGSEKRNLTDFLGEEGLESMTLAEVAALHAAAERYLAASVGGTPRTGLRPPMVISGQQYEALPDFLLDPHLLRELTGGWDFHWPISGKERKLLRQLADATLTRRSADQLLARVGDDPAKVTQTLYELYGTVERMWEKGAI